MTDGRRVIHRRLCGFAPGSFTSVGLYRCCSNHPLAATHSALRCADCLSVQIYDMINDLHRKTKKQFNPAHKLKNANVFNKTNSKNKM